MSDFNIEKERKRRAAEASFNLAMEAVREAEICDPLTKIKIAKEAFACLDFYRKSLIQLRTDGIATEAAQVIAGELRGKSVELEGAWAKDIPDEATLDEKAKEVLEMHKPSYQ